MAARVIELPKMKDSEPPTMPLTVTEYTKLLDAVYGTVAEPSRRAQVTQYALLQLIRWSGLAIGDALRLRREDIRHDTAQNVYRTVTARQKTGTDVYLCRPAPMWRKRSSRC